MGGGSNLSFLVLSLASLLAVWHHANVVQESASILDKLYTLNFWLPSLSVMHWLPPLVTKLVLQTRKIASLLLASLSLLWLWSALRKKLQINKESHLIIVPSSKFELFSRNVLLLSSVLGPQVVVAPPGLSLLPAGCWSVTPTWAGSSPCVLDAAIWRLEWEWKSKVASLLCLTLFLSSLLLLPYLSF